MLVYTGHPVFLDSKACLGVFHVQDEQVSRSEGKPHLLRTFQLESPEGGRSPDPQAQRLVTGDERALTGHFHGPAAVAQLRHHSGEGAKIASSD